MRGYKKYFSETGMETSTVVSNPIPKELNKVAFKLVKLNSASHDNRGDEDLFVI